MADVAAIGVDLTWDSIVYKVEVAKEDKTKEWKTLVNSISGTSRKARLLAIMGPSGAGKTTLMNSISGRIEVDATHTLDGTAYLNNTIFAAKYKKLISFVAQDDIVMGKDTPREALYFSHRLRSGTSHEESLEAVEKMIVKLSIQDCADTLLGIPGLIKGVSGGEKKRVNIGSELINNPLILMLDEPTTGLDSVNAFRVGKLLQSLAHDDERTVLCTIHAPSSELYGVFDDVLLLAKGHTVYHGAREDAPEYFASIGHAVPSHTNPSEFFMELLQEEDAVLMPIIESWKKRSTEPDAAENLSQNQTPAPARIVLSDDALNTAKNDKHATVGIEMALLTQRSWRTTIRDPAGTMGRLIQTLFFAIFFGLFYFGIKRTDSGVQDIGGVLFMMTMNLIFLNVMSAITVFAPERAVFLMEMTNDTYSAVLYYISKVIAELPIVIFFPIVYVAIVYYMIDLAAGTEIFFVTMLIAICIAYCGNAFGMFAASLFPKPEIAMTVTPLMIMPMFIVGGLFANTERLEPYWIWLNAIAFPRYAYKAFMTSQFDAIGDLCADGGQCRYAKGTEVLTYFGFDKEEDKWPVGVGALLGLMLVFRVFGAVALWVQGRARRSHLVFEDNFNKSGLGKNSNEMDAVKVA
jgi:ABC-type multidrug transport system ATPase subunit